MASIMRFDQWQNSLGQNYGTILQIQQTFNNANSTYGSGDYTLMSVSITPKMPGSKIYISSIISHGFNNSVDNNDPWDTSFWFKRNSTIIGINPSATRNGLGAVQSMYTTDVQWNSQSTYKLGYETIQRPFNYLDSPTYNVGDTIVYSFMARFQTAGWINRSSQVGDSGSVSSITVMEIAQ